MYWEKNIVNFNKYLVQYTATKLNLFTVNICSIKKFDY